MIRNKTNIKYIPYIVVAILILIFISFFYIIEQRKAYENNTLTYLTAVNNLHAKNISVWYTDEIRDAQLISQNRFLKKLIQTYISSPNSKNYNELNSFLTAITREHSIDSILFIDTTLSNLAFSHAHIQTAKESLYNSDIYISNIYHRTQDSLLVIDFSVPVFAFSNEIIGTLIFQHALSKTIKPIITQKTFQESLLQSHLFYKESSNIISYDYHNNTITQHSSHIFPIPDTSIQHLYLAPQSESINQIIHDSMLTSVTAIPDTDWFLYSSLPIEIVYEKHYKTQLFISILIIILFLLFITILAFIRMQRRHPLYKKIHIIEQEFKTLFYSIGDTIIVTDTQGVIQKINAGTENLIHKKEKDVLKKHIDSIIQVIQEKNKVSHQDIIKHVLNTGKTHTMFRASLYTSDGNIIPIYESIAPIRNNNNTISGLIFFIHNQTEERRIQQELEETNRQLESLFTNLPGMFYRCQNVRDWNMDFVSNGSYELTGYFPAEFISNTIVFGSLIHPDDKKYVYSTIQESLSQRSNFRLEYRIFTKDNHTKWIWEKGTGLYDNKGNIIAIEGYIEDITEFKHTQISLKNSEEMYRKQFEEHTAIQFLINPETGQIININKAGEDYYGWSKKEILQKKLDEINVLSQEEILQQIEYYQSNNIKVFESEHYRADGSIGNVEVYSSPVEIQGKTYIHSIVHDVTEKKQAENKILLQSHAIEQSPVSIIITDNKGTIEYVNKKFCEISKYSREEVMGKDPSILRSNNQSKEFYTNIWNTIISGKDWAGEFENKKKNGSLYWEKAIISPIKNKDGVITHFIAIKEDITEKKNLIAELTLAKEKAEENDTLKSAFLANMSHEIRTPMNGIVGFSEFLKDPNLSFDLRKKYAHIIIESSKQLLTIVNDILDISRIESKTLYISKEAFSLNELFTETYDFFVPQINKKDIEFTLNKDLSDTESYINSDKSRIKQILTNLISNAIKFTESGFIKIGYTIKSNTIELFVHDTGIGISPKNQEIIFKSFQQVQHASKKQYGGTGLGLAISHEIAHLLGGTLTVESTEGKGSKFKCSIPYSPINPPHREQIASEPHESYTKNTVLVAEDDDTNFLYLQTVLSFTEVEVVRAHNGEQAIQTALKNSNISLIFMDVKMPKINGFEASKEILSHIPDLPIIILSAYNLENERTLASEIGCYDYIVKPIKKDTVTKIIAKILKNQ